MLQGFHYWPDACERFGIAELVDDPRFATIERSCENAAVGAELVAAAIKEQDARRVEGAAPAG